MLTAPEHVLKFILTTRTVPVDLLYVQPARQWRLDLEEGLASPFAENMLRAMDPDGRLGLQTAPQEDLARAREHTRGCPRALEALAAVLNADRDITLHELLDRAAQALPDQIVEALVGQAFSRLERLDQRILQALSVYGSPVPAVAVDYLLEPFIPTIDSGPALSRMVNMHFRLPRWQKVLPAPDRPRLRAAFDPTRRARRIRLPRLGTPFRPHAPRPRGPGGRLLRTDSASQGSVEAPGGRRAPAARVRVPLRSRGLRTSRLCAWRLLLERCRVGVNYSKFCVKTCHLC